MPLNWTPDLAVGIDSIDGQHKELFLKANLLMLAISKGRPQKELIEIIEFLEGYIFMHFGLEEQQMQQYAFPDFQTHKSQHDAFIENFTKLRKEYLNMGATPVLAEQVQQCVCEWLTHHVQQTDKALAIFLRGRGE